MAQMIEAFKAELVDMRKLVALEESTADPALVAAARDALRQKVGGHGSGRRAFGAGRPSSRGQARGGS